MRRTATAIGLAGVLMAATAGSASAATLAPTSADFGSQPVGGASGPRTFTLTPELPDLLPLTIATTGDFRQTNTCGAALQFVSGACTISVTFVPTAAGVRTGTLSSTTLVVGGPTASLRGTATGGADGTGANKPGACKKKKGKKKKGGKRKGKKSELAAAAKRKGKKKGKKKGCKKKKKKKKGKKKK